MRQTLNCLRCTPRVMRLGACVTTLAVGWTTMVKPGQSLTEKLDDARAVILGRLTSVSVTDHPQLRNATLGSATALKGPVAEKIRVYSAGAIKGAASLWLLGVGSKGQLTEDYPIVRISPDLWPYLPAAIRSKVWKATDHAETNRHDGVTIHAMRVPSSAGQPLQVWIAIENRSVHSLLTSDTSMPLRIEIGFPGRSGSKQANRLIEEAVKVGPVPGESSVLVKSRFDTPSDSGQIALIDRAAAGEYLITIELGQSTVTMRTAVK